MREQLPEVWRTEIPGEVEHAFLCDPVSGSLFVGDGWIVAYSALRLHRLDLSTGKELASLRTRHQPVYGMTVNMGHLYAATNSRLFELSVTDLAILRQWDRGLVRFSWRLESIDSRLVMANWWASRIGIFDPNAGRTRRLEVGTQPLLVRYGDEIKVIAGFEGGMWTLDGAGKLVEFTSTPPVASAAGGRHIWATLAGPAEGGEGQPPVWKKRGTSTVTRLTGEPWQARLSGVCSGISSDDQHGLLWCMVGDRRDQLQAISQATGEIVASVAAARNRRFCHLDAVAGIALAMEPHHITRGNEIIYATSTLICYSLRTLP